MPQVNMTIELGNAIKELRAANKVRSKDISSAINKSPTYVSKLEHGEIQKIDYDDLMKIFHTIFPDERSFETKFEEFIGKCTLKYSEDEREREVWLQNFDTVYRKIPVPSELVDYCNEQLAQMKVSITEVVARVNLNEDIKKYNLDLTKYKKNINYWENEHNFILMDIDLDVMQKILSKEIVVTNYVTMESFIYNLLKYTITDFEQAHLQAIEILTKFKFYSIVAKSRKLHETHSKEEADAILTDFDKVNQSVRNRINHHIGKFTTLDIKYANEKLAALSNNFDADPSLTIAYLGINLSSLKDLDVETKRSFLKDISDLIKKYGALAPKEEKVVLL